MGTNRSYPSDLTERLLAGVSPDARHLIIAGARSRILRAGEVLFRTGELAERLFVLRKGRVQFSRQSRGGQEIVMGILGPGDVFGEIAVLTSGRRTSSVVATSPMRLIVLFKRDIWALEQRSPAAAERLRSLIASRQAAAS